MNKKILFLFFFYAAFTSAQTWKIVDLENNKAKTELEFRKTTPTKYNLYHLDTDLLKNDVSIESIISLPNHNGTFSKFSITEHQNFTNSVASKYGYIKSFSLKGIDDKTATGKISIGKDGFHAVVFSGKHSTTYIDPYTKDKSTYILYNRKDLKDKNTDFGCLLEEDENIKNKVSSIAQKNADDGKLRTYKLALACTGEYAQFHVNNQGLNAGTDDEKTAAVLSAMNTTMTRVNGLFERDVAATFTIVLNSSGENELIFLDSETDNLTNDSAGILIDESQNLCDNTIGSDNYDIGHTFSTGAGGLAGLGVLCSNGQKGRGVTGTNSPIGDTYDVDYVAHEIGHQFGASHTFNNSCSGNRSSTTSVEPGSGTTIMAYAGICTPNIQNQSDDYFHAVSIDQMWTVMQQACGVLTDTNNEAPIVNAGNDFSVPRSTPIILTGSATDIDNSSLTYCWEQIDNEIASMPPIASSFAGPSFRSLPPSEFSYRYLPALSTVISGSTENEWEVIPSTRRTLDFSFLVRDNNTNGGATGRDDMTVSFTSASAFLVTSQNTAVTWNLNTTETITWDKSTTDQAPINCQNVKIMLSIDGGATFTTVLTESTPNDGSFDFVVSDALETTDSARIMILAIDNIFYNVNSTNFSIISNSLSTTDTVFENFSFFPNPVEDSLHLIFNTPNSKEPINIDLFDITGKTVKSLTLENNSDVFNQEIDFKGLNSGIYMLKVKNGDKQTFKKLIFK